MRVPIGEQRLHRTALQSLLEKRFAGEQLRGEDLLCAVEEFYGKDLPSELRDLFAEFSAPSRKRRGRPCRPEDRAREDFALEQLDSRYGRLLRNFQQGDVAERRTHHMGPSERAYEQLAREMSQDFGPITWEALRNKHTRWKHGRFHPMDNCTVSQEFEAEIERQFPSPASS